MNRRLQIKHWLVVIVAVATGVASSFLALPRLAIAQGGAKKNDRVDLQDVNIRGEAARVGLLRSSRARTDLGQRIWMKKDFKDRVLEDQITPRASPRN
jgi:hypothetical protein